MTEKFAAIYHEMRRREGFEKTAGILWCLVTSAARQWPGKPRALYMDIEGHRVRTAGGYEYDADATEVISFVRAALGPYLTETPWGRTDDSSPQTDDLPDVIIMSAEPGDDRAVILTGDKDQPVRYEPIPSTS